MLRKLLLKPGGGVPVNFWRTITNTVNLYFSALIKKNNKSASINSTHPPLQPRGPVCMSAHVWNVYNPSAKCINILHIVSIFTFWKPQKLPGAVGYSESRAAEKRLPVVLWREFVLGFFRRHVVGGAGHCCAQHFTRPSRDGSSPPLTSSGLGSRWGFKQVDGGSSLKSTVCRTFVCAVNRWRKACVTDFSWT